MIQPLFSFLLCEKSRCLKLSVRRRREESRLLGQSSSIEIKILVCPLRHLDSRSPVSTHGQCKSRDKTILSLTSLGQKSFDWDKTTPADYCLEVLNQISSQRSKGYFVCFQITVDGTAKQHVVVTNGRVERSSLANTKQGKHSPLR
jgi:hypothetical protein